MRESETERETGERARQRERVPGHILLNSSDHRFVDLANLTGEIDSVTVAVDESHRESQTETERERQGERARQRESPWSHTSQFL